MPVTAGIVISILQVGRLSQTNRAATWAIFGKKGL